MKPIAIDPRVDFACHLLLGHPEHPKITLHFLNAILRPDSPITQVTILNPIVGKEFDGDKLAILDILATDIDGRMFNIEVQRAIQAGLAKRLTYYVSNQLVGQIGEGDGYHLLRPSIGICILDASLFPKLPIYCHDFQLRTKDGLLLSDCLQIHLLELPKYRQLNHNTSIVDPRDQWIHFFRYAKGEMPTALLASLPDPIFEEAVGVLEMISRSPAERSVYEARLKSQRDEQARLDYAIELGKTEGIAQGIAEGKAEGKAQGIAEGKAEGKAEGELYGRLTTLQEVLDLPVLSEAELSKLSINELQTLASNLQDLLRNRKSK